MTSFFGAVSIKIWYFLSPKFLGSIKLTANFQKTEDFISMKNSPFEALKGYVSDLPKRTQESIRLHINHPSLLIQLILWDRNIILIKIPKQMVTIYVPSIAFSPINLLQAPLV